MLPAESAALKLRCPACGQIFRVRNGDPKKAYACKTCKAPLQVVAEHDDTVSIEPAVPNASTQVLKENVATAKTVAERPAGPPTSAPTMIGLADDNLELQHDPQNQNQDLLRLLPQNFGSYRIIKEIARGGMGAVLLAEQTELRRKVAMKVVLPFAGAIDPTAQERFMREGRAMAKLRHPHIIQVFDVGTVSNLPYLTMEFIEGRDYSDLIDEYAKAKGQGGRSLSDMLQIVSKVARALAFAHAKGVVHRDIKPANIMVRVNGEPVVMDFGLAKDYDSNSVKLSMTGNIMGTPSYMSPEQAQGLKVDARSDIYSLGAVLYEVLTLETPFEGETTIATIYNVVNKPLRAPIEVNKSVPPDLSRVCSKALEKNPDDRYASMDEFAADLDRFGAGMNVTARGPSIIRRATEFAADNRGKIGGAIAAAAAIILVLVVIKMGWLRPGKSKADELREALTGGSAETRLLHVKALAGDLRDKRIQPDSPEAADARAALRTAAADSDPSGNVAAAAVTALGEINDQSAIDVILQQLDTRRPAPIRRAAVNALSALKPQVLSTAMFDVIKNDPDLEVRLAAVEALPEAAGPQTIVALIRLSVKGEPPAVAQAAGRKLSKVRPAATVLGFYGGGATAAVGARASELVAATNDYNKQLEEALGETTPQATSKPKPQPYELAVKNLNSSDKDQRVQAAFDLGILADNRAEPALVRALADSDEDVALAAAESLGKFKAMQAPEKLVAFIKDATPSIRKAAARACGLVHPTPDLSAINSALLSEKFGPVQAEMAVALGRAKFSGGLPSLFATLSQGSPEARVKCAWALGQIGDKSACAPLVEALAQTNDAKLKEEIAAALSAITGKAIGTDAAKWRDAIK